MKVAKRNTKTALVLAAVNLTWMMVLWACTSPQGYEVRFDPEAESPAYGDLQDEADQAHAALMLEDRFPSAQACRACHPDHYRDWAASPHAYAQLSPVFNAMHATILKKMNGTTGDFCIRCHTPVGMTIGEHLVGPNELRHPVSLEGVTCIVCHRMDEPVGKVSGRRPLDEAPLVDPIYGPTGGSELARVIASPDYRVQTDDEGQGRQIHGDAKKFDQLTEPGFCGACHDVNLPNGFRLEEAFSEYKTSPAAARGESCQDCHMGSEPGIAGEYPHGPAAIVGGKPTRERRLSSHSWVGPDYSIVHPGIFPHNPKAQAMATMSEWLTFDWLAGWGSDDFEDSVTDAMTFPDRWSSVDDRYDARELIDEQLAHLDETREMRLKLLRRGYLLSDIEITESSKTTLSFRARVSNGTDGHNVPTGFTAERLVFLQVMVRDAQGRLIYQSGDLDPNGDVRDGHSVYVHNGELPLDDDLFSLQSKFITLNNRGSEREQVLAVNHSIDALPFLRPETFPSTLTGAPSGARIHKYGIEPGGGRDASYSVDLDAQAAAGPLDIEVRLIAAMVPVNLVAAIQDVGFDYGMSPREVARRIVEGHLVLWEKKVRVDAR